MQLAEGVSSLCVRATWQENEATKKWVKGDVISIRVELLSFLPYMELAELRKVCELLFM